MPRAVEQLLTADVAAEIAGTFEDNPVYPGRVVVDNPENPSSGGPGRRFPGWTGPVLVLSDENQGVCSWGVPLDGSSDQVLVGGDLLDAGRATVTYVASVADFIAARRWDYRCLYSGPLLMAQAAELDQASLGYLQARFGQAVTTAGWPGARQYRFEQPDARVLLWAAAGQCDWWISATGEPPLRTLAAGLLGLSDLRRALFASDDIGARVLGNLREPKSRQGLTF